MSHLGRLLLGLLVSTSAFAADWTQLAGGKDHLCWLDAGGARCLGGPDLSGLKDPYWLGASDQAVCARDHEPHRESRRTELCGKFGSTWRCGSIFGAPEDVGFRSPHETITEAYPSASGTCVLAKSAYCIEPGEKNWTRVSDGFVTVYGERRRLVVSGDLECHLQEYHGSWTVGCGRLRPEKLRQGLRAQTFEVTGLAAPAPDDLLELTLAPSGHVCALVRLPVAEGSKRLRNRIYCSAISLTAFSGNKKVVGAISEGHWFLSNFGRLEVPFFDPQSLVRYGNGVCAREDEKLRCWDLVANQEVSAPELKPLVPYDFTVAQLAPTLTRVADILYSHKAKLVRRLAGHLPEDETARAFVLNAVHPFLDNADSEAMASARHFYRRARAEMNARIGLTKSIEFPQTKEIHRAALELLVDGLRAYSDTLPAGTEALLAAAGEALATEAGGAGLERLLEQLPEFRKLLPSLETNTRTAPLAGTVRWIFDYLARS
jgi:hypothetical protein